MLKFDLRIASCTIHGCQLRINRFPFGFTLVIVPVNLDGSSISSTENDVREFDVWIAACLNAADTMPVGFLSASLSMDDEGEALKSNLFLKVGDFVDDKDV